MRLDLQHYNLSGITTYVGRHAFRHWLTTLLVKKQEGIKVLQELMRHADEGRGDS